MLGTKGDVIAFDPRFYVAGEHSLIISASEHVFFLTNQLTFRIVLRADGQPLFDKPITLQDGVTQASGLVVLN